jgi:hypothetical protein
MLTKMAEICSDAAELEARRELAKLERRGTAGLNCGRKAHILDAMELLDCAWGRHDETAKYATKESILRCWRKADILPVSIQMDYIQAYGSLSQERETISTENLSDICALMKTLTVRCGELAGIPNFVVNTICDSRTYLLTPVEQEQGIEFWNDEASDDLIMRLELEALMEKTTNEEIDEEEDATDDKAKVLPSEVEMLNAPNPNRMRYDLEYQHFAGI